MTDAPKRIWAQHDTKGHRENLREMAVKPVAEVRGAFTEYVRADVAAQVNDTGTSNYHAAMMNVQIKHGVRTSSDNFAQGHKEARHACAEIALEADARIAALEAENERLRDALADHPAN